MKTTNLRVFYGFDKLNKIQKKRALSIIYENCRSYKNEWRVSRWMEIAYTRLQTEGEAEEANGKIRTFTRYAFFIDEKPFFGDIDKVLGLNYQADRKNLSETQLNEIQKTLRSKWMDDNPKYKPPINAQLQFNF